MNKPFLYTRLEIKRQFRRRNLLILALVLLLSYYFIQKGIHLTVAESGSRISPLAVWTHGFANMQLLIVSILSLLAGFRIFRFREFNKFLYTALNRRLFFLNVLLSGIFPFFLFLAIHEIAAIIMLRLNGFSFAAKDQLHFLIQAGLIFSVSLLFYLTGVIAGSIKSKGRPFIVGLVIWFALVFIIPGAVHEIQSIHNYTTAGSYNLENHQHPHKHDNFSQIISMLSLSTYYQEAIENFNLKNGLPKYFWTGAMLRLLYALIMLGIIHSRWNRFIFHGSDKSFSKLKKLCLSLKRGETLVLLSRDEQLIGQIFSALCGKAKGLKPLMKIEGKDIEASHNLLKSKKFVYICHPDYFPGDIKTRHFVQFMDDLLKLEKSLWGKIVLRLNLEKKGQQRLKQISQEMKTAILSTMQLSMEADIYMIYNPVQSRSPEMISLFNDQQKNQVTDDKYILLVTGDPMLSTKIGDRVVYLLDDPTLTQL